MHITRYTDYSLRVLIYTSVREGELATIKDVAEHYGISRNHLMKVVHKLGTAGYLETVRGKKGGFRLAKSPEDIGVGEVVRCTEEDFNIVQCFEPGVGRCRIESACMLQTALHEALAAFLGVLDRYSLADLVRNQQQLSRLLDGYPLSARRDDSAGRSARKAEV
ncbi:MAG: Rrf2 family transcriptional regulator [Gammaproteobacteria bacterium]